MFFIILILISIQRAKAVFDGDSTSNIQVDEVDYILKNIFRQ